MALVLIVVSIIGCHYRHNTGYFLPDQRPAELKSKDARNRFPDSLGNWEGSAGIYMVKKTHVDQEVTPNTFGLSIAFTDTTHPGFDSASRSSKECDGNYFPTVLVDSVRLTGATADPDVRLDNSSCYEQPGRVYYSLGSTVLPGGADSIRISFRASLIDSTRSVLVAHRYDLLFLRCDYRWNDWQGALMGP